MLAVACSFWENNIISLLKIIPWLVKVDSLQKIINLIYYWKKFLPIFTEMFIKFQKLCSNLLEKLCLNFNSILLQNTKGHIPGSYFAPRHHDPISLILEKERFYNIFFSLLCQSDLFATKIRSSNNIECLGILVKIFISEILLLALYASYGIRKAIFYLTCFTKFTSLRENCKLIT